MTLPGENRRTRR